MDKAPDEEEYRSIFSFISLRHYELIAALVKSKDGGKIPGKAFWDQQHNGNVITIADSMILTLSAFPCAAGLSSTGAGVSIKPFDR
jgi:hypothetical protein